MELTIWAVGRMCNRPMPQVGKRGYCPFRKHKRTDKTLTVFRSKNSDDVLYKCFSCDPPGDVGDAVQLFANLLDIDRKTAWHDLKERGYKVPGLSEGYQPRQRRKPAPKVAPRIPMRGDVAERIVPLDLGKWAKWSSTSPGALTRFAEQRCLDVELLRKHDVFDVSSDLIGFGYRDPSTHIPCRVKMRTLERKSYWIEPRPPEGDVRAKALAPLYLCHLAQPQPPPASPSWALITEGETDALSLRQVGIDNIVSLPDGAASAARVDLVPLTHGYELWLSATDADEEGTLAHKKLFGRGAQYGINVVRVLWRHAGGTYKDASEALCAGFTRADFVRCIRQATKEVQVAFSVAV